MKIPLLLISSVAIASSVQVAERAAIEYPVIALYENQDMPSGLQPAYAGLHYSLAFVPSELLEDFRGELLMPLSPGDYYIMRVAAPESLMAVSGKIPFVLLGEDAIFKTDPAGAATLSRFGWGLTRLSEPATAPRTPAPGGPPMTAQVDSNILEMISVITPQSSRLILSDLSAIWSRNSYTQGCRQAEQYVFDYLVQQDYSTSFFNFQFGGVNMRNVIGEKLGEVHPESIIIVCAHLDCISETPDSPAPGAEDNASGCAVVLETARAFSQFPCDMTVRFITFSGEEQGLIGSDQYAAYVQSQGALVAAVLNVDMVGYSGPYAQDMYIFSDHNSYSLGALGASIISDYTNLDTNTVYNYFPQYGSDHYSFAIRGYPAIFFIDAWLDYDWYPFYHTSADTVGNLNLAQQASIGRAVAAMTAFLSRPDFGPQYVAGDANGDGAVNGIDVIYLVGYLKGFVPAPEPILRADANGSCSVNGLDVVYLVSYLKGTGAPPFYGECR
ncbi:MAG: hypothetical protein A2W25_04515 [candidate division Zixibacteria bacterium RBG_16_53_22]|nr:MAG: hypothetical protein A2W25_04515 [candidate division Zixibacteria bacterium RBG_16_53_22]